MFIKIILLGKFLRWLTGNTDSLINNTIKNNMWILKQNVLNWGTYAHIRCLYMEFDKTQNAHGFKFYLMTM